MAPKPRLAFDPEREEADLRSYLGPDYSRNKLERYEHALHDELTTYDGDEATFYRSSHAYLYDLTVFAMSATKLPYLQTLTRLVAPGSRLLDYGCGIGSDGLLLLDAGYRVEFADFDNPSTAYLRWRLAQRSLHVPVHDLDKDVPAGFDAVYSFDVIEHVRHPFEFLSELEARAALVIVNLLEIDHHEHELHYPLPIDELLAHAAARQLVSYQVLHGSSHLVAYRPEPAGRVRAWCNRVRIAATRHSRRRRRHAS